MLQKSLYTHCDTSGTSGSSQHAELLRLSDGALFFFVALVAAKNALTDNLVNYYLSRLNLLRDMGLLDFRDSNVVSLLDKKYETPKDETDKIIKPDEVFEGNFEDSKE